ncbi:MAG: hypothetical protein AB8B93_09775 [Pseudomonadales bacterium]
MNTNVKLGPGDLFPELKLTMISGSEVTIPGDMDSPYTIVLFYRGHW